MRSSKAGSPLSSNRNTNQFWFCTLIVSVVHRYFFSSEPSNPVYGDLTLYQRLRVVLLLEAWTAGFIFVTAT